MGANTNGLKRDAGPGRPKGRTNKIPGSFKASIKQAFEKIATDDPQLVEQAIRKGLKGKPREAYPYVQLAAYYIDGKPVDNLKLDAGSVIPPPFVILRVTDDDEPGE